MRFTTEGLRKYESVENELMYYEVDRERRYGIEIVKMETAVSLVKSEGVERVIQKEVTRNYFDKNRPPELKVEINKGMYEVLLLLYTKSVVQVVSGLHLGIDKERRLEELRKGYYGEKRSEQRWDEEEDVYVSKIGEYRQIKVKYRGEPDESELKLILEEQQRRTGLMYQEFVASEGRRQRYEGTSFTPVQFDLKNYVNRYNEIKSTKGEIDLSQFRPLNKQSVKRIKDSLLYSFRADSTTVEKNVKRILKVLLEQDIKEESIKENSSVGLDLLNIVPTVYINTTDYYIVREVPKVMEVEEGRRVYEKAIKELTQKIKEYIKR